MGSSVLREQPGRKTEGAFRRKGVFLMAAREHRKRASDTEKEGR